MTKYRLTVDIKSGDVEKASIEADTTQEAAFLLGAQFGMTAALRDRLYAVSAKIVGIDETVDTFVESAQDSITSVSIKAV